MLKILLRIYSSKRVIPVMVKVALEILVVKTVLTPHRVIMRERILGTSCLHISRNRFS